MRKRLGILALLGCLSITHNAVDAGQPANDGVHPRIAAGPIRTAVMLLTFPDVGSPPFTPSEAATRVFGASASFDAFIRENSYDRNWITGSTYGWLTLPNPVASYCPTSNVTSCNQIQLATDAATAAQSTGYVAADYDRVIYAVNGTGGGTGGGSVWLGAISFSDANIAHEFGHTLGGQHANSISCPNGPPNVATLADDCQPQPYGDREDPMGSGYQHYSSYNKAFFGFLPSDQMAVASAPGTFDLAPLELPSANDQGLRVPVDALHAYVFEYRRPIGLDALDVFGNPTVDRVVVRLQVDAPSSGSTLVLPRALHLGDSFVDPYHGIAVSVSALTPDHATLQVQRDWASVDIVDGASKAGQFSAAAFDGSCTMHVLYLGARGRTLRHATRAADGSWSREDVDTGERSGEYVALAVDAADGLHAAYYESSARDLKYAYRAAGESWIIETVDALDRVGEYASIAVAPDGAVHIAYYDSTHRDLRHASRAPGGSWEIETVDGPNRVGISTAIAVAPSGTLHISYVDATLRLLRLATRTPGGPWTIEDLGPAKKSGNASALRVDATNALHVAYYDGVARTLRYARRSPTGAWIFETIDAKKGVGAQLALAVDPAGAPVVVVYRDDKSHVLRTAIRPDTGGWTSTMLGNAKDDRLAPALATGCGEAAGVHASFYDRKLRILRRTGVRFTVSTAPASHLVLIGDFDGDGVINPPERDRMWAVYNGATPTPEELSYLDVNGNGVFDFDEFFAGNQNTGALPKRCLLHATDTNQRLFLVGDLNQSGTVITHELARVAGLALGFTITDALEIALADANADGQITTADVPLAVESHARSGPLPCIDIEAP